MRVLITGGGVLSGPPCRDILSRIATSNPVLDKLTYAGNLAFSRADRRQFRYSFTRADICDRHAVFQTLLSFRPMS